MTKKSKWIAGIAVCAVIGAVTYKCTVSKAKENAEK